MNNMKGFTLLELSVSIAILTIALAMLFTLMTSIGNAAQVMETKAVTADDSREGIRFITQQLRQAAGSTIGAAALPANTITYMVADDVDGNGVAVNVSTNLELSASRRIMRDVNDMNADGLRLTQLILLEGGQFVRVIANNICPDEDLNANGVLDPGEDLIPNGRLDRGIWFERAGGAIRVTIQVMRRGPQRLPLLTTLTEVVSPRN